MNGRAKKRHKKKHAKAVAKAASSSSGAASSLIYQQLFNDAKPSIVINEDHLLSKRHNGRMQIKNIHELILWILSDTIVHPQWLLVKHKPLVNQVVVVMVPNLTHKHVPFPEDHPLSSGHVLPLRVPSSMMSKNVVLGEFINCHLIKSGKRKRNVRRGPSSPPVIDTNPLQYLLTRSELELHNFPLDMQSGWVETGSSISDAVASLSTEEAEDTDATSEDARPRPQLVALDCEMCITCEGLELTRVSLVDEQHQVLLDTLILPANPILDYNTRYSGITAEMMQGVTKTLEQVQAEISSIITKNHILVGHSLENDFIALRMLHRRVIDTSVLYPHRGGLPYKSSLRYLAKKYLEVDIQQETHDSIEDARVTMRLAQLKIERGSKFGVQTPENTQHLFDILAVSNRKTTMIDLGRSLKTFSSNSSSIYPSETAKDTVRHAKTVVSLAQRSHFVFVHLRTLQEAAVGSSDSSSHIPVLHEQMAEIYDACGDGTVIIAMSGDICTKQAIQLQQEVIEKKNSGCDSSELEAQLQSEKQAIQAGVAIIAVK